MRRLSMKSKRRKSDATTDSESEENGVTTRSAGGGGGGGGGGDGDVSTQRASEGNESESASRETQSPTGTSTPMTTKSSARKRGVRERLPRTPATSNEHEPNETAADGEEAPPEQENGNSKSASTAATATASPGKRRKKDEPQRASTSGQSKSDQEYEVEKLVGHRTIKGRHQFLVRWKGYGEDSDTWENEKDLKCPKLIEDFLEREEEEANEVEPETPTKPAKTKTPKSDKKLKRSRSASKKDNETEKGEQKEADNQKEYEVEKIIDVYFKKNKKKEFLIRWKGFTSADDTWEPEENLNCPDLIVKFMQKVEQAKTAEMRELRTNPAHTKRYTLTTHDHGRRLSRRNMDKQRTTYHECDE